jgi:hypothetical protein
MDYSYERHMVNQTSSRLLNSLSFPFLPSCRNFSNRLSSLSLSFLCETLTDIAAVTNSAAVSLSLSLLYFFLLGVSLQQILAVGSYSIHFG